ncbi:unnamed protein product [Strongylus vulgaris]|uniref:Uncharacterized protein n=1 Tax=Strongylus vulgaris TaxID=40348 RepID=A0A3P7L8R6_STRVU|nr:unnamed protein product [Strongylus vulgaris]
MSRALLLLTVVATVAAIDPVFVAELKELVRDEVNKGKLTALENDQDMIR